MEEPIYYCHRCGTHLVRSDDGWECPNKTCREKLWPLSKKGGQDEIQESEGVDRTPAKRE